jgi:glycosyltransferase involved in cell wall biosynthesis
MDPLVTIVIPDIAGLAALSATLTSLARHTPEPHVVMLLEEAGSMQITRPENLTLQQIIVPAPFGIPAALNQSIVICKTPYILLLETGAIVTSGWLSRLLEAFDDEGVGLSGPSTNICWNEQQVFSNSSSAYWSTSQIDAYALDVVSRYASQRRYLDTLHGLNDFCYLFKRSVADQLGGFDEAYGPGPCWEIDFNTRAARAGFCAVWVSYAYVHRAPATDQQQKILQRCFTNNKHLYQNRFCGLRLKGEKVEYESHCRGEACEHFAPADLIQITLRSGESRHQEFIGGNPPLSTLFVDVSSRDDKPLVSCIMPTRNRRAFIRQTLVYFERQSYPHRELIIVDDGDDNVADLIPAEDPRIRYISLPDQISIGAKRNRACQLARGDIIAHWDDDDWYAPHRLEHQIAPLLAGAADLTGLETSCFFDPTKWEAWTCSSDLHRRLFVGDVHGGSLVYWRRLWENGTSYPDTSLAEDALFLQRTLRRGAHLQKLPHDHSFVYLRHAANAWRFPLGSYLQPSGWERADPSAFLPAADLSFYASLSPAAPTLKLTHPISSKDEPLVSCIMPTYNRRTFVGQAIAYFLNQDYVNKELIVVDDGTDAICDLFPVDERIRYIRLCDKKTVGAKRNLACEEARGSIIVHWDDDDWHAPHRVSYQVGALLHEGTDICGTATQLFYDVGNARAWQYVYPHGQRPWLAGSTLCYTRAFWAGNRFADINVGEDARFIRSACVGCMTRLMEATFHIGIIHRDNVSPKKTNSSFWRSYPIEEMQRLLGVDWNFYHTHQ